MISYIFNSIRIFFTTILTIYFFIKFINIFYILLNGVNILAKMPIIIISMKKININKYKRNKRIYYKFLNKGNQVKEITI
jgi:hypothetical protein